MSFSDAMAQQPLWVTLWLNVLLVGAFVLPIVLLFWRQSRKVGAITLVTSVVAAFAVGTLYDQMGYVKLLGLPHLILWGPLVVFLLGQARRPDMPHWPQRIIWVVMALLLVSLAFDLADVIAYLLGNRTPTFLPT